MFIDEECGNLIVVNDGGELTENISQKKTDVLQWLINVYLVTNVVGESISSVSCGIFIVKQLGKYDFSYDFLLSNKYEKQEMFF